MLLDFLLSFFQHKRRFVVFLSIMILLTLLIAGPLVAKKWEQWQRSKYGVPAGVSLENLQIGGLYLHEVEKLLVEERTRLSRWPIPASINHQGIVTSEVNGYLLDLEATLQRIEVAGSGEQIKLALTPIIPSLTAKKIFSLRRPLGIYHTYVQGSESRYNNIKVAAAYLNYSLILPGEVFSFNRVVGAPTEARGFLEAPIIVDDELVPGYGGGICQISSTLYNAALEAGMEIIERHSHSQDVNYVPPNKDATVAYDYLDLKFSHSLQEPVLIRIWLQGRRLQIGLYGPVS